MVYRKLSNLPSHTATDKRSWALSLEFKSHVIFLTLYYFSIYICMNINMSLFKKMSKSHNYTFPPLLATYIY